MRDYSFRYLDLLGRQQASDFMAFKDDEAATVFARTGLIRNAVVEVWKRNELIIRLHRLPELNSAQPEPGASAATPVPPPPANTDRIVPLHGYNRTIK